MTVEELIKRLRKVKNKQAVICFMTGKDDYSCFKTESVDYIAEDQDTVILF